MAPQIVDDLRPEAAYFNESFMHTPNIDRLGQGGLVLNRAYCQQAVRLECPLRFSDLCVHGAITEVSMCTQICGPTRNSFLSGRRPQRTQSWNFKNSFRDSRQGKDWVSFPQYFKGVFSLSE